MAVAKKPRNEKPDAEHEPKHTLGERIHEHIVAAEVAAEEAAGYGARVVAVEAVEAAVDPEHELGHPAEADEAKPAGDGGQPAPKK
jgi:hypothetical protein